MCRLEPAGNISFLDQPDNIWTVTSFRNTSTKADCHLKTTADLKIIPIVCIPEVKQQLRRSDVPELPFAFTLPITFYAAVRNIPLLQYFLIDK